jgi:nucleoside 2-deoxyribosyltransferase
MLKAYLAGALFTMAERRFNEDFAEELAMLGGTRVHLPQSIKLKDDDQIFRSNLHAIDVSDYVIAMIEGPDTDSGTAFEIGYAFRKGIPVIAVRTDFRKSGDSLDRQGNIMITCAAVAMVHTPEPFFSVKMLAKEVYEAMIEHYNG